METTIRDNVKDSVHQILNNYMTNDKSIYETQCEIADAVFDALGINEHEQDYFENETTVNVLNSEKIALLWGIDDVMHQAKEMEVELTEKQAKDVLSLMDDKHDANIGISWDVIGCWIDHVLTEDKKEQEAEN